MFQSRDGLFADHCLYEKRRGSVWFVDWISESNENLGHGYLAATILERGWTPVIRRLRGDGMHILREVVETQPICLCFTPYYTTIEKISKLAMAVKRVVPSCTILAGGQLATYSSEEVMRYCLAVDAVVRWEGETILPRLLDELSSGVNWASPNIVFRGSEEPPRLISTNVRYCEVDCLDNLPNPLRYLGKNPPIRNALGIRKARILATRGCKGTCHFCPSQVFFHRRYKWRVRSVNSVLGEMDDLRKNWGVNYFHFNDQDIANWGMESIHHFARMLSHRNQPTLLHFNLRPDAHQTLGRKLLRELRCVGLFHCFVGLEFGTDEELQLFNKGTTVQDGLATLGLLKELGVSFDVGLIPFHPWVKWQWLESNWDLASAIGKQHLLCSFFHSMNLYPATEVHQRAAAEGLLKPSFGVSDFRAYEFENKAIGGLFGFFQSMLQTTTTTLFDGFDSHLSSLDVLFAAADTFGWPDESWLESLCHRQKGWRTTLQDLNGGLCHRLLKVFKEGEREGIVLDYLEEVYLPNRDQMHNQCKSALQSVEGIGRIVARSQQMMPD